MINKKSTIDFRIIITALICLTLIEICALFNGINGTALTVIVGIIAGAIGISIPKEKLIKN